MHSKSLDKQSIKSNFSCSHGNKKSFLIKKDKNEKFFKMKKNLHVSYKKTQTSFEF
jgi:hypothetical protein